MKAVKYAYFGFLWLLLQISSMVMAQNLTQAEYFFNSDPGVGNGIPIVVEAGDNVDFTVSIPVSGLESGFHSLFIRIMNENGKWSLYEGRSFYVQPEIDNQPTPQLTQAEYFFDTDPGIGLGMPITITQGIEVNFTADIPVSGLESGFHTLFIRILNENGKWSLYEGRNFYVQPVADFEPTPQLTQAEYFFDTDPGVGEGIAIDITQEVNVNFVENISVDGLAPGFHTLFVRFINEKGIWSLYEGRTFNIQPSIELEPATQLTQAEYFFDTDPGFGQGTAITFEPDSVFDQESLILTSELPNGYHTLFIRFKNDRGVWGMTEYGNFSICVDPEPDFSFNNVCLGDEIIITDLSTNVYEDAIYAWDINNDGTIEYDSPEGFSHTFLEVGLYPISLTITNNGGCTSAIVLYVEVYPLPEVPTIEIVSTPPFCDGNPVVLSVTDEYSSYLWSTGEETQSIAVTVSGEYSVSVTNEYGCSITSEPVSVEFNPVYLNSLNVSICQGESYILGTQTLTETGEYTEVFTSTLGCDSTVVLTLTVNPVYNEALSASICQGESYTLGTQTLTESGVYTEVFSTVLGCDSTVVLTLTVVEVDVSVTLSEGTLTANATNATYQWVDCNNDYTPIPSATEQSFTPNQSGSYAVEVTQQGCTALSECVSVTVGGTEEQEHNPVIRIYPNPNDGNFVVELQRPMHLYIYNLLGRVVYSKPLDDGKQTVNLEYLPSGVYIVKAYGDSGVQTTRVCINR
jgi:hypothetical protein